MSYSRWSCSRWYTFWCARPLEAGYETRDNATFEISTIARFTASALRADLESCLDTAVQKAAEGRPVTPAERSELHEYMLHFLEDVDARYRPLGDPDRQ